jgi:hypothetical protein
MDPKPAPDEVLSQIVDDIANAISKRTGETEQRQAERFSAASGAIMSFQPVDPIEAMLSGLCVLFHELILDSAPAAFGSGEQEPSCRATRSSIMAMDRSLGNNLTRLKQYRQMKGSLAARPTNADSAQRLSLGHVELQNRSADDQVTQHAAAPQNALPETVDPAREGEQSPQAWLATQMAGLNRQGRRALDRQVRKRFGSATSNLAKAYQAAPDVTPVHNEPATTASAIAGG